MCVLCERVIHNYCNSLMCYPTVYMYLQLLFLSKDLSASSVATLTSSLPHQVHVVPQCFSKFEFAYSLSTKHIHDVWDIPHLCYLEVLTLMW